MSRPYKKSHWKNKIPVTLFLSYTIMNGSDSASDGVFLLIYSPAGWQPRHRSHSLSYMPYQADGKSQQSAPSFQSASRAVLKMMHRGRYRRGECRVPPYS